MYGSERLFTRDEVSQAVNAGADLVTSDPEIYLGDEVQDLVNLIVNAQLHLLDTAAGAAGGVTLNGVIVSCYQEEGEPEDQGDVVEGFDEEQSATIRTVRGWVA